MSERWILNASPTIIMAKIGKLDLLTSVPDEVVLPEAVAKEILAGPEGDAARLAVEANKFRVIETPEPSPELVTWDLGAGETSVISYALEHPTWTAILDDGAARRCAASFGIHVKGSLAVVILARKRGIIPSAKLILQAMREAGLRLDDQIIRQALNETVGENW
jgi:predicted nucleic acid-binding protein